MGYKGVLGMNLQGVVEKFLMKLIKHWIGKRVVGEINAGCKKL